MRKLSRRSQQRIARNLALLESIVTAASMIDEGSLTDLVRRDAIGIGNDGFPSNSMPEHSGGGFGGSSTETAALYGLSGANGSADDWARAQKKRNGADVVRRQLQNIERNLHDANKSMKAALAELKQVNKKTEEARERKSSTPCSICGVYASQKSGWCLKDYEEWIEDGRPDRTLYAMWRRQDTNSEGMILVPHKPKGKQKT